MFIVSVSDGSRRLDKFDPLIEPSQLILPEPSKKNRFLSGKLCPQGVAVFTDHPKLRG